MKARNQTRRVILLEFHFIQIENFSTIYWHRHGRKGWRRAGQDWYARSLRRGSGSSFTAIPKWNGFRQKGSNVHGYFNNSITTIHSFNTSVVCDVHDEFLFFIRWTVAVFVCTCLYMSNYSCCFVVSQETLKVSLETEKLPAFFTHFQRMLKQNKGGNGYFVGETVSTDLITNLLISNMPSMFTRRLNMPNDFTFFWKSPSYLSPYVANMVWYIHSPGIGLGEYARICPYIREVPKINGAQETNWVAPKDFRLDIQKTRNAILININLKPAFMINTSRWVVSMAVCSLKELYERLNTWLDLIIYYATNISILIISFSHAWR